MADLVEMSGEEYAATFTTPMSLFHSAAFNLLNAHKCGELKFLALTKGAKATVGIAGAITDSTFLSPFSAPFAGPQGVAGDVSQEHVSQFSESLVAYLETAGVRAARIVLPPMLYAPHQLSGIANGLFCAGFHVRAYDLSYHFDLSGWNQDSRGVMERSARKNLAISLKSNLEFLECRTPDERAACYEVIRKNREEKEYPLRMTYEEVTSTAEIVDTDFALVRHTPTGRDVAAAIVYRVAPSIAQVIYWGGLQEYNEKKPMNFLSYRLFQYLKHEGLASVDVGPSTSDSIPNFGLVRFKRNIGCEASGKLTFAKEFS